MSNTAIQISKKILCATLALGMMIGTTACTHKNVQKTVSQKVCQSQTYPGNGYVVKLAADGDTITQLNIVFNIDKKFLKDQIKKGGAMEGYSLDDAFNYYESSMYQEYQNLTEGNGNLSYFSANYQENQEAHQIVVKYNFVTSSKVLKKGVSNPDSDFYEWISYFGLQDVYDSKKKVFSYKKLKSSYRFQHMAKMKCKNRTKKNELYDPKAAK